MKGEAPGDSPITAGGAIFTKLKALGVSHVFTNAGTDFPPIIEGLVEAQRRGLDLPLPVTVPHEHAAVSMAHGFYQVSGRAQAVMLHTNVGLSNGATAIINAWCDHIPMIVMSGRTPTTERGRFGARTVPIGWGQEMFDQEALIREATKWQYEIRFPEQVPELLDRAWAIANSGPKGPVYLSLPREVLCEPCPAEGISAPPRMTPVTTAADGDAVARAARALARADNPVIIAQRGAGGADGFAALTRFVEDHAIPLVHYWPNQIAIPMGNPMQVGADPSPWLAEADVVLALDCLAPWMPDGVTLRDDATIIQAAPDPLFGRTPVRNFPADITLAGDVGATLAALIPAVGAEPRDETRIATRRKRVAAACETSRAAVMARAEAGASAPMTKDWVSLCLGRALKGRRASVFHELGCPLQPLGLDQPDSYFQEPFSGGLGWGMPAAIGAKMADPDRLVVATVGDGSYMFANPTACHFVAEAQNVPVIVLVLNNEEWAAVRYSVQGLYPEGESKTANEVPLTSLRPSPDFAKVAEASRAYTETVTDGRDLPAALDRAIRVAEEEQRQVLLNIAIARG